ncbi:hypothetical protein LCGC14_0475250 [marine sediment metagenome]|uniref:Toprim domain-containing protein n=1 Tax=marine sediment metagenome TaxID=412755 RepID=A0A0F9STU1_9ZZZZ
MSKSDWVRIEDAGILCAICQKPNWCLAHIDGKRIICPRVKSNVHLKKAGFMHKVFDNGLKKRKFNKKHTAYYRKGINWKNINKLYCSKLKNKQYPYLRYTSFALELGISKETLEAFGLGWDGEAWTFPARDGNLEIVGIMRRFPDGHKIWVSRSKPGLFIPKVKSFEGNVFVTEGVTDAAAMVDYGFRALGRSNCQTGVAYIKNFLYNHPKIGQVTIVGDNDPDNVHGNVGQVGAFTLAKELYKATSFTAVLEVPEQFKDVRLWLTKSKVTKDEIIDGVRRL